MYTVEHPNVVKPQIHILLALKENPGCVIVRDVLEYYGVFILEGAYSNQTQQHCKLGLRRNFVMIFRFWVEADMSTNYRWLSIQMSACLHNGRVGAMLEKHLAVCCIEHNDLFPFSIYCQVENWVSASVLTEV